MKKEYELRTGSFKERGARNALLKLSEEERKVGVIAASAGNHALALAYHGGQLDITVCSQNNFLNSLSNDLLLNQQDCRIF